MIRPSVSEAYALIADLTIALGAAPLARFVGCWEHRLGDRWLVAVNGHGTPTKCSVGVEVPPFHAYIERDGWPAAMLTVRDGLVIGHGNELEDTLLAELKAAIHGPVT